ncbi:hypothetical protein BN3659_01095 [Alistipes sp. CHKCI003]|nr:hypothetical protein BN3659_01095 [Alistipes sp. CHKCI003]
MLHSQKQGTPVPVVSVASDGTPRPSMGDIQILPISDNTRKWLSVLDNAKSLRAAFVETVESDPRGVIDCRNEVLGPLDVVISTLEDHYLSYSLLCDLDRIATPQTANDHDAE